ncbi:MAG TPA: hypothetical protein QGG32_09740 [Rhodospirillales bacterium]|jgi:hypothetical protein|nr:hypothetical protein [Rhodospirillales bacterium]
MTEQSKNADRSSRVICESIASTVIDLFVDRLLVEANLSGDRLLDAVRISELTRDFKDKDKYLRHIRKIAEDQLTEIERDHWKQHRKRPFERILVLSGRRPLPYVFLSKNSRPFLTEGTPS